MISGECKRIRGNVFRLNKIKERLKNQTSGSKKKTKANENNNSVVNYNE